MSRGRKATLHGIVFDSQIELARYIQLYAMAQAGEISNLTCHPVFELQPRFVDRHTGKIVRPITYTADFQYCENGGLIVEDVKARDRKTGKARIPREGRLRIKLFQYQNRQIEFRTVVM